VEPLNKGYFETQFLRPIFVVLAIEVFPFGKNVLRWTVRAGLRDCGALGKVI